MPSGKKRKRHKMATHKRKKRLRKNIPLMQDSHKPKVPLFGTLGLFALQAQVL